MKRLLLVCALALLLVLPGLAAANGDITVIRSYNAAAFEFPSGVAVDKVGNVFITLQPLGQVWKFGTDGTETLFRQFPLPAQLFGLAVDAPGDVYVGVFPGVADPAGVRGVWRLSRNGASYARLLGTDRIFLPNGLAFDKDGNLYVTDSWVLGTNPPQGAIWRIPPGGEAQVWLQDSDLLGGVLPPPPGISAPVGANGIAYRNEHLYISNTLKGSILDIPVLLDGSSGVPRIITQVEGLTPDGLALDVHGRIYAALVGQDRVVAIDPMTGEIRTLAEKSDGIDGPASLAFGTGKGERQSLYITNSALRSRNNPPAYPSLLKMDVGVPGWPLP